MKNKLRVFFIIILVSIFLFSQYPETIAWGGWTFQTVPTLGPSRTPTSILPSATRSPTRTFTRNPIFTSTPTQNPSITTTSTNLVVSTATQIPFTSTPTIAITLVPAGATLTVENTLTSTDFTETGTSMSPSFTETTLPSEKTKMNNPASTQIPKITVSATENQQPTYNNQAPPGWLFPALGSILLVGLLLLIRSIFRKKINKA